MSDSPNVSVIERTFEVRGIRLAAKHWNPENTSGVIALHGWLDNAASFDPVSPELNSHSVLALDQAGGGQSEFRPPSSTYHLWDDLLDVLEVADQLGWQQFSILGHSRGAMLAVMLAAACPERIKRIALIDGLMPIPEKVSDAPQQLSKYLAGYRRPNRPGRFYKSYDELVDLRAAASGITREVAEMLATRSIVSSSEGYYWRSDSRLKAASAIKMTDEHNRAFIDAVRCPVKVFVANQGLGAYDKLQVMLRLLDTNQWHMTHLQGHHHLHMDNQVKEIGQTCDLFFS